MQSSQFKSLGFFNQHFIWFQTRQPLETYSRSEQTKPLGDHQDLPPTKGVGYLNRFQGYLLPYTYTRTIQEMPEISHPRFKALPLGLSTAPLEFTVIPKEVKLMAIHKDLGIHQYLDDWLVRARSHQACLQHTKELVNNVSATGLAGELIETRAGAQARLQFVRLPVRPQV